MKWHARPWQRGLYRETQGEGWTSRISAKLSVEVESDDADQLLTPADIRRSVLDHLQAAAEGLSDLGLQEDADNLLAYISDRKQEWKLNEEK